MIPKNWGKKGAEEAPPEAAAINERPGRCKNCAGYKFKLRAAKGIYRICDNCGEEINLKNMEVVKHGNGTKN